MNSWGKAIGFGFLVWLVPFVVAFMIFPFHESSRPLFESIMAVTVTGSAIVFGILYLRNIEQNIPREALQIGIIWFVIAVLVDAPLMLFGGPMYMTMAQYFADIGVSYLIIPLVTVGLGHAYSRKST